MMEIMRNLIVAGFILLIAGGFYMASDTLGTLLTATSTVQAIASPEPEKKPVAKAAPKVAKVKDVGGFAAKFRNKLVVMDNGSPKEFDSKRLAGVEYIAYYYSASWCPPCRAFTPDLVSFYNSFKPSHPNFELIFVGADNDEASMFSYMSGYAMPWPAVWYTSINDSDLNVRKYAGRGIPDLVLVDYVGNVLSDSYQWGNYRGPREVMNDIRTMVK